MAFTLETLEDQEGADAVQEYLDSREVRYYKVMDVQETKNGILNFVPSHNDLELPMPPVRVVFKDEVTATMEAMGYEHIRDFRRQIVLC